jgi:hypothetical protein
MSDKVEGLPIGRPSSTVRRQLFRRIQNVSRLPQKVSNHLVVSACIAKLIGTQKNLCPHGVRKTGCRFLTTTFR